MMIIPIEAIILDIGGVLWHPNDTPLSQKWAARCGLEAEAFDRIVYASEWGPAAMVGTISNETLWTNIGQQLGLSAAEQAELEQDEWAGIWDTALLEYLQRLKAYSKLGVISNAFSGTREIVKPWVNERLFDVMVFSCEEGICKPDTRIYQCALERLGIAAGAAVFIDDRLENVTAAQQVGMSAVHYNKSRSEMLEVLKQLLTKSVIKPSLPVV
jgi:putative hydrolase of the HAD superfamily